MNGFLFPVLYLTISLLNCAYAANEQFLQSEQVTGKSSEHGGTRPAACRANPRFSINADQTVTDTVTGLIWTGDANIVKTRDPGLDVDGENGDGAVLWRRALEYVQRLNAENFLGYNDWRLPNVNELATLAKQDHPDRWSCLTAQAPADMRPHPYWSSSTAVLKPDTAWAIDMNNGSVNHIDKSADCYVWPVRGGQPGEDTPRASRIAKTGQTTCHGTAGAAIPCAGTGQDGELRFGTTWSSPRFIDSGNQTLTDTFTGLTWTRDANPMATRDPYFSADDANRAGAVSWPDAACYVEKLNREEFLGFSDWRLPSRDELVSLVNYGDNTPPSWLSQQGFVSIQPNYWSSGSVAGDAGKAWRISPSGIIFDEHKASEGRSNYLSCNSFVWPVRGGQAVPMSVNKDGIVVSGAAVDAPKSATTPFISKGSVTGIAATAASTLKITTPALEDGFAGVAYSQTLTADGGKKPYSWSKTGGKLPSGLALKSNGVISGTPTAAGSSSLTLSVKDAKKAVATRSLTITVNSPLSIVSSSLESGHVGSIYSQTLMAAGGKAPYSWTLAQGSLPAGLNLDAATGAIVGTPTVPGDSSFAILVKDANKTTATCSLSMTVYPGLSISASRLRDSFVGIPYNQTLTATGGKAPYTWVITSGTLPTGCILDSATGIISGTPTVIGNYSFTVQVMDGNGITASESYSLTINSFGAVNGTVTDGETGAPLPGVNVTLVLSGITGSSPGDLLFTCNTTPLALSDNDLISANDEAKFSCSSGGTTNSMYFKARNPYGTDAFSFLWNGMATKHHEYLAQSFRTGAGGNLSKVSFYPTSQVSGSYYGALTGEVHVQLKTKLGGDTDTQLAQSNSIKVDSNAFQTGTWVDFTFSPPVPVKAGQEYYLEIQGQLEGGCNLWQDGYSSILWGNGAANANGSAYRRSAGLWNKVDNPLAFRTYVEDQPDIEVGYSSGNLSISMGGSYEVYPLLYVEIFNPVTGEWESVGRCDNYLYGNSGGFIANSADLSVYWPTDTGYEHYYDQNGWLTVKVTNGQIPYWWNTPFTSLVTDQFSMSFTRTRATVTDANGAYSFTSLPAGNYSLSFEKPAYAVKTAAGALPQGQTLSVHQIIEKAQPASLHGKASYSGGSISGITVTVTDPVGTRSTVTDSQGNYLITGIVSGNYSITFEGSMLQTRTLTGNLSPGQSGVLDVVMTPLPITLAIRSPSDGDLIFTNPLTVTGNVQYADSVTIHAYSFNTGKGVDHAAGIVNGTFSASIPLADGDTRLKVIATNNLNQRTEKSATVTLAPFTLHNLGDTGNVTVMEAAGNYDAKKADGLMNDQPRQAVSKEFFKSHADLDFLILLSTFDYALPENNAQGFYLEVKNDTQGINRPIFDNSASYGSAGRLQGTIDMGNVTALASNLYGQKLDTTLTTLSHELMHRFGAYVRFKNPDGTLNTGLLGRDDAHWSWLLDSRGSIMYGNGWKDNGDGTFTSTAMQSGFSPLDLYLMGILPKEQVPPMLLIENITVDRTQLPQLGATVSGAAETVTIDDIIAAEGARIPDATASPKTFKLGYVLLTREGDDPSDALRAIETLRTAFAGRFAELTGGKGSIEGIAPTLNVYIESPADGATVTGPDVAVTGAFVNSTGAETGVTVNGIPAAIAGSRFIVNRVPLQEGSDTITVTATDLNGLTASVSRTVTAKPGDYISLKSTPEAGVAPLGISLNVYGSFPVANPRMSVSGPVPVELVAGGTQTEYTASLPVEGTYTFTARVEGPDGNTYNSMATVIVENKDKLDALLRGKWNAVNAHLAAGDTAQALNFFTSFTRKKYQAIFSEVKPALSNILASYREFRTMFIGNEIARYKLITQEGEKEYAYDIVFEKDENGLWLLRSY
jgi:hypothetical protein